MPAADVMIRNRAPLSAGGPVRPWLVPAIAAGLFLLTWVAYWRAGAGEFLNLDDDAYVEYQPLVNQGFRAPAVVWALSSPHSSNWHPLTTFSHMLDCQLFGVRPGPMHVENVLWHALNAILVFLAWRSLTRTLWPPVFVAALFALHPLHVESVAWISERKDVLSAFFWLLGLLAYSRYVRHSTWRNYVLVALAEVLALLSKPMAVTFPCTLLLLDYWPLARWPQKSWSVLVREKLPLFALAVLHSAVTFAVQSGTGADSYGHRFPFGARLGNAVVSYFRYLGKTLWPESLSPLYHHPGYWPGGYVLAAVLVLAALTAIVWHQRRRRPWLAFGWLWFLGTLVPVIGIVQVGAQSMADRYTYVPLLGIFTIIACAGAELAGRQPFWRAATMALGAVLIAACTVLSYRQVRTWRSSVDLYHHSLAVGEDNAGIRFLLGVALAAAGRPEAEYVAEFQRALQLQPDYINARTQLAKIAMAKGKREEARQLLEENIHWEPWNAGVYANLGSYYASQGEIQPAIHYFDEALSRSRNYVGAHENLARIYFNQKRPDLARPHFEAYVRLSPWNPDVLNEYATFLVNMGQLQEALKYYARAVWIRPDFPQARQNVRVVEQALASRITVPPPSR